MTALVEAAAMKPLSRHATGELGFVYLCLLVACFALLGVPVLAVGASAAGTALFLARSAVGGHLNIHPLTFALVLLLFLGYAVVTGGLSASAFIDARFYDGEGRIFLAYLPFFAVFALPRSAVHVARVRRLARFLLLIVLALLPIAILGFSQRVHGSHHAAGYMAASAFLVFFCFYRAERSAWQLLGVACAIGLLLFANSRTAVVALVAALALRHLAILLSPFRALLGGAVLALLVLVWSQASPYTFQRFAVLADPQLYQDMLAQIELSIASDIASAEEGEVTGEAYNILTRVRLWVRATAIFLQAPLIGIGAFRFNDLLTTYEQVLPGVSAFTTGTRNISVATAHNSYFQLLAELGVIGTLVFLLPWYLAARTLMRGLSRARGAERILRENGLLHGLFLFVGAMTGHLFAAPSALYWCLFWIALALRNTSTSSSGVPDQPPGAYPV